MPRTKSPDVAATLGRMRRRMTDMASTDRARFIRHFLRIEDKDAPGVHVPFDLWPEQVDVLRQLDEHRLTAILKARQLGLTWLVLAYALCAMIGKPGFTVLALSRTEDEAKELVRRIGVLLTSPAMGALITPEFAKRDGLPWYRLNALELIIHYPDGLESTFKAFPSAAAAGRSFTANLLFLDEWAFQQYAREIWQAAFPTVNRPTGGQVIGLSTIERGSLFEEIYTGAPGNGFNAIFLPWYVDPRRTQEWYEATRAAMGDAILADYPATVDEALSVPGGAYFPEFDKRVHVVPYVKREAVRYYVGMDYGLDMFAAYVYEVDHDGDARIVTEVYEKDLIVSRAATALNAAVGKRKIDSYFAPPDLWNRRNDSGRSAAEIFADNGISLTKTSNDRESGSLDVKEWLRVVERRDIESGEPYRTAALTLTEGAAPNLERCLAKIQKDKRHPNEYANDPHELTHSIDALRAFCAGRPRPARRPESAGRYNFDFEKPRDPDGVRNSAAGVGEGVRVI